MAQASRQRAEPDLPATLSSWVAWCRLLHHRAPYGIELAMERS